MDCFIPAHIYPVQNTFKYYILILSLKHLLVLILQAIMSEFDDTEFITKVIAQSEKVMCAEMAKLRKSMQDIENANEVMRLRVDSLESENAALKKQLSDVQLEVLECKTQKLHEDCSMKMQMAFTAALQTFTIPQVPTTIQHVFSPPVTTSSTPQCSELTTPETYTASNLLKRKRCLDNNSTSQ